MDATLIVPGGEQKEDGKGPYKATLSPSETSALRRVTVF